METNLSAVGPGFVCCFLAASSSVGNLIFEAIIKLSTSEKTIGEVFNIGGIEEISILNLANKIIDLTNSKSKVTFTPYEDAYSLGYEDMERRVPNLSKIMSFIDWAPKITLDEIILDVASYELKEI